MDDFAIMGLFENQSKLIERQRLLIERLREDVEFIGERHTLELPSVAEDKRLMDGFRGDLREVVKYFMRKGYAGYDDTSIRKLDDISYVLHAITVSADGAPDGKFRPFSGVVIETADDARRVFDEIRDQWGVKLYTDHWSHLR